MHATLFRILAVLRPGPASATSLLDAIRVLDPGNVPSLPTFYRHLREGVDSGWIQIQESQDEPDAPGRPSRTYALTPSGVRILRAEADVLVPFTRLAFEGRHDRGET